MGPTASDEDQVTIGAFHVEIVHGEEGLVVEGEYWQVLLWVAGISTPFAGVERLSPEDAAVDVRNLTTVLWAFAKTSH